MHLREVTLRNWKSYRSATFRFSLPRANKKVILVGAMNGTGKTSFLTALYLGLFGREAMYFLEGVKVGDRDEERSRSYRQVIQRVLHRPALETEDPNVSVSLLFEDDSERQLSITRTWRFTRGGHPRDLDTHEGEEVRIDDNGSVKRPRDWQEANNRIAELLFPAHVMPCFFFDGEQAQARVEASGAAALSEAINVLYATRLVDELDESLKVYIGNQRAHVKREVGDVDNDQLDLSRAKRDALQLRVQELKREIGKVRADLDKEEAERKQRLGDLGNLTGDATIDTQQLLQRKVDLKNDENALRQRLNESLGELPLPLVLRRFGERLVERLQGEVARDRWEVIRSEAIAKADHIVASALPPPSESDIQPPLSGKQHAQLKTKLRAALETLWSPPPPGIAKEFLYSFLSPSDRLATQGRMRTLMNTRGLGIANIVAEWQTVRVQLKDAERRVDAMQDVQPRIERIKESIQALSTKIDKLNQTKATLEQTERGVSSELRDVLGAIGQMESRRAKLGPVERKLDHAERVRSVIAELRESLVPLCKNSLGERCTEHFRAMISDEFKKHRVEFDQDLQPMLTGAGTVPVYISTLSGAQKRAFGLAFTLAVAEITGEALPIIIDTPVGNMDSQYRERILTYLAKTAPGQIMFLSHDEEIYGPYIEALKPFLLQTWRVDFEAVTEGSGVSTLVEGKYLEESRKVSLAR